MNPTEINRLVQANKRNVEQRIRIMEMEREIITNLGVGRYYTAKAQLRDLMAYVKT